MKGVHDYYTEVRNLLEKFAILVKKINFSQNLLCKWKGYFAQSGSLQKSQLQEYPNIVEAPVSRHPRDQKKCPLKDVRAQFLPRSDFLKSYGRSKMNCLYVARNMTKCPLTRGVRLQEVSVSGGSTVYIENVCSIGFLLYIPKALQVDKKLHDYGFAMIIHGLNC